MIENSFNYKIYDSFLNKDNHGLAKALHGKLEFFVKETDLFKFLQTSEIAQDKELKFFLKCLNDLFETFTDTTDCFYTIFASYYREGDYLLCHDDRVDNRRYAFTYYLDDYESGDLVLYNSTCDKQLKRLNVVKNRLVIFEVTETSWHEVAYCNTNGRRAFTGWINHKSIDHSHTNMVKYINDFKLPEIAFVDFEIVFDGSEVVQFPDIEYDFSYVNKLEIGPFYMRKVNELILNEYLALSIPEFDLFFIKAYEFEDMNYILLNDYTNDISGNILDIFIIECTEQSEKSIKFLNGEGILEFSLEMLPKVLYAIKRKNRKYFIQNGLKKNFKMVHMIYKEIS